jgi:hypothetical protein
MPLCELLAGGAGPYDTGNGTITEPIRCSEESDSLHLAGNLYDVNPPRTLQPTELSLEFFWIPKSLPLYLECHLLKHRHSIFQCLQGSVNVLLAAFSCLPSVCNILILNLV